MFLRLGEGACAETGFPAGASRLAHVASTRPRTERGGLKRASARNTKMLLRTSSAP
jgi:hypothetical protein